MKPLSEMRAAEIEREYEAWEALSAQKAAVVHGIDDLIGMRTLERYRAQIEAFANLVEAAWDNTMGPQFAPLFDALEAAEQREDEAAREAEQRGAA